MDWMKELKQPGWLRTWSRGSSEYRHTEASLWLADLADRFRLYTLMSARRRQLTEERHAWDRMAGIIHALLYGGM